jgi:hypothetical protein
VLRNVVGGEGLVDVTVAKNRGYLKAPLRLEMDHRSTAFREVDVPPAPARSGKQTSSVEQDAAEVRRVLLAQPGIAGKAALRAALRAGGSAMGHGRVDTAQAFLEQRGEIENRGTSGRPRLRLRAPLIPSEDP